MNISELCVWYKVNPHYGECGDMIKAYCELDGSCRDRGLCDSICIGAENEDCEDFDTGDMIFVPSKESE